MAYSGRVEQIFHRALLHAFDRVTLERLLVEEMNVEFENVVRRGNFSDETWDLVRWADDHDRLKELMEKAGADTPDNPYLKEALKQLAPELIENRWFAKFVPLATWIIWAVNVWLVVALFKIWMMNLIDLRRVFLIVTLAVVVSCAVWVLYQRLVGGPIRSFAALLLLRRLIAHSRLERTDWISFALTMAAGTAMASFVGFGPDPVAASFQTAGIGSLWRADEFELMKSFQTPPNMESQSPGGQGPALFSRTFYRVVAYVGAGNVGRPIKLQIDLLPAGALDPTDDLAKVPSGVTFAHVAFDRTLANIAHDREFSPENDQRREIVDQTIEFNQLSVEQLKGFHTVLFTCQRNRDAQPNPIQFTVYARLIDPSDGSIVASDRSTFKLEDWKSTVADRLTARAPLLAAANSRRWPDAGSSATADPLLRLSFGSPFGL